MFTIWAYLYSQVSNGDIKNLTLTYRSKSSSLVHPTSSFTAAVQDVSDGLVGTLPRTIARSHCRSILPKEKPARTHNDNITNFFISFSHPFFSFAVLSDMSVGPFWITGSYWLFLLYLII